MHYDYGKLAARSLFKAFIVAIATGVILTLAAIYGLPIVWQWVKPLIHAVSA